MATSGQGDLKNQDSGRAGSVPESFKNRGKMSIEGGAWMRVWEITQRVDVGAHTQRTRGSVVAPPLGEGARSLCPLRGGRRDAESPSRTRPTTQRAVCHRGERRALFEFKGKILCHYACKKRTIPEAPGSRARTEGPLGESRRVEEGRGVVAAFESREERGVRVRVRRRVLQVAHEIQTALQPVGSLQRRLEDQAARRPLSGERRERDARARRGGPRVSPHT